MQTYLKTRPPGIQFLLFIGMAFGVFLIFSLIGMAVLTKLTGISILQMQDVSRWDPNDPNMIFFIRGMLMVQFFGLFVVPALLFGYFSDPKPLDYLGLKKPSKQIYWVFAIIALIVAIPFVDYMGYLNQKMLAGLGGGAMKRMEEEAAKQIQFMLSHRTLKELALNLFFIAVTAGVGEELLFRGVLQRIFIKWTRSPWAGILLAAALFSMSHFQFYGFIPRFLLGALLGALYWYSGSLWTAILAHFFYDAFMIVLIYLNPELLKNTDATIMRQSQLQLIVSAAISLAVSLFILWQMKKRSVTKFEDVYRRDEEPVEPSF